VAHPVLIQILRKITNFVFTLEPAGRVSPKFPKSAKSDSFEVANGAVISLLCDAQAFPAPAFRSVH